jgi:2-polyprenyl-3-methyl-5-hydroxy-6-metoxy-1,4-benzoquinol methylase
VGEQERVTNYFDTHAQDFDTIYEERKGAVRTLRDRLSRGTVTERLTFVRDFATREKPASVLDVGCGAGRFSVPLAQGGSRVVGIDPADAMVAMAMKRAADDGVASSCRFVEADYLEWDAGERFALSLGIGLFDYMREPGPMLAKIVADTDGHVIASFPKRWHPLVPLRKIRLSMAGCPVFFYTRSDVERLAKVHLPSFEVTTLGRDFMLVGRTG